VGVLTLLAAPMALYAQFTYNTNTDGTLTITGYTGSGGAITIPTNINGLTVSGIGTQVLFTNTTVTSLTIPGSVTNFANNAFWAALGISTVTLGNGISSVGSNMFSYCTNLSEVTLPSGLITINTSAFANCRALSNVTIPATVTSIGAWAFEQSGLTNVSIPASVINISAAFVDCPSLTNVVLSAGLENMGSAFADCTNLKSITIPSTVNEWDYAFQNCTALTNVSMDGLTNIGIAAFESCTSLGSFTIPASVTQIQAVPLQGNQLYGQIFQGCANLTNLTILGNPTIGEFAFSKGAFQSVYLAGGIVGSRGFEDCSSLSNLTLGNGVTTIGDFAFDLSAIGQLTIPDSVTYISDGAFEGCPNLTNVIIGTGLATIEDFAFDEDPKLTSVLFLGNAPAVVNGGDQPVFGGDPANVYYLPGTTGWSNTFGTSIYYPSGAPTALWNPTIQTGAGSFGVSNGQFGFNVTGTPNIPIVVEACTNLENPVWTPVASAKLTNGTYYFTDSQWTNFPNRYYGVGFR
jgi:hypothetical protein